MQGTDTPHNPPLTIQAQRLWDWLTAPFHPLPNPQDTYRVRALAALILSQMVFGALVLGYIALSNPDGFAILAGIGLAFVIDVPIYLLSRTRHFRWGAALHTLLILLTIVPLIASPDPEVSSNATYFLILSVLVASMFLSRRIALAAAGLVALVVIILSLAQPQIEFFSPALLLFIGFSTSIVLVESYLHDRDLLHISQQTQALATSEQRYRRVMETTFDAILLSRDGIVANANDGFSRVLGYDTQTIIGRSMRDFFCAIDGSPLPNTYRFDATQQAQPLCARHQSGRMIDVELVVSGMGIESDPMHIAAIRDVTHLRQVEQIRHEDDLRYRALFEQTNDMVILVGLDRRILAVNQQACNALGYAEQHLIGEEYSIIRLATGDFGTLQTLQRLFSGEKMAFHEQTLLKHDGTLLPVEFNITLVRRADGKPSHIQYIARNITERKNAERERLEHDLRYRALFEQTTDGVTLFDLEGKIITSNPQSVTILGYAIDEMMGEGVDIAVKESEQADSRNVLRRLLSGEHVPAYERTFYHKNGSEVYVEINATLVRDADGNPRHIQSILRDITGRKEADIKRQKNEARYRALFEQTNDIVFLIGLDGTVIAANRRAQQILGYTEEEFVTNSALFNQISNTPLDHRQDVFNRLLIGEVIPSYETTFTTRDGEQRPVEVNVSLVRDEQGNPSHIQSISRDITERKAAERQQREDEARYRALFEQSNDMVFIISLDGRLLAANQQGLDSLGYTAEEYIGTPISEMGPPDDKPRRQSVLKKLLTGEKIAPYEMLYHRKDGTVFPVETNVTLVYDSEGNPSHLQAITRDITERRAAERQQREDEARYRALFEQSNDMVFIIGLDGRVLAANTLGIQSLGYEPDEMIGKPVAELGPADDKPRRDNIIQRLLSGEKIPPYELLYHHKDGSTFPVEANVSMVFDGDGNPSHMQAISRDITERKDAERQQREDDARYRALFEQSNDMIVLVDLDATVLEVNQQVTTITGFHPEEVIGKKLSRITPDNQDERRDNIITKLLDGERIPTYEMEMHRKDGGAFPVEINAALVYDADGNPSHVQSIIRDISERKNAERQQREDDARYRALFEQTNDLVFLMSLDATLIDVNQQGAAALGYSVDELIGQPVGIIANPYQTEAEHRQLVISRVAAGEVIPTYEYDFYRKDGSNFTAEVTVSVVRDAEGQPTHVQSVIRDITERKAAERARLEDELRYRALFEQSNDMVYLVDMENRIIAANKQATQTLGYNADELVSQSLDTIVPDTEWNKTMRVRERMLAGERIPIYERIYIRKNGERFPAEVNVALVHDLDGTPSHFQSIARDITARKEAQARYRALFDQARDAVFIVSLDNDVVMVNQQAVEMTGHTVGGLLQMKYDDLIIEGEREASLATFERVKAGKLMPVYEHTFQRKMGDTFPIEINAVLVHDTDGNPLHIQCVVRDITDRKRAQDQQLDLAITRERVHVLQEFIDHASHDFGTPITNIKTSLYLLRNASGNTKKQDEYIERLDTHVNRLQRLLADLLAMSRLEKDSTGRMRYARLDVNMLIREISARQESTVITHGHQLHLDLADEMPSVLADKMALGEALTEILENAIIYTRTGGDITIRTRHVDNRVQIEIEDTGIGIDSSDTNLIFNSFYRADSARSSDTGGTGLGLAIAKKIIDSHDGSISVTSTPGKGSIFTVGLRTMASIVPQSASES